MRKAGLALQTERAYVGKVKAFMRVRGLTCLADFERIGAIDVEAHFGGLGH